MYRIGYFCFLLFFTGFSSSLLAQDTYPISQEALASAKAFQERYGLSEGQMLKMAKIEARKERHLSTVAGIAQQDRELYLQKMTHLYKGRENSIRLLLEERQLTLFEEDLQELRIQKAQTRAELRKSGLSEDEIQLRLLQLPIFQQ